MRSYGYGEDALTQFVLTHRMGELLEELGDASAPGDLLVFLRPSFGRGGGSARNSGRASAFGEFDAIVATTSTVYPIETKWSRSGEVWRAELALRSEQSRRHEVLEWYILRWRDSRPVDWDSFRHRHVADFESAFPELTIPRRGTSLARNLEFVLDRLAPRAAVIQHVLLYIDIDRRECPPLARADGFKLVRMRVPGAHWSGFFHVEAISGALPEMLG